VALRLLVIGDVAWDIFIRPARELVRGSDVLGTVDVMPGGAAANVAVWARRLGASVRLVCKLGDDTLGALMAAHLHREDVGRHALTVAGGLTTRVGVLVGPDGEHSFVIDHTKVLLFGAGDVATALLDQVDAVFFNGYDIFLAGSTDFLAPLLAEARRRRIPIVFDPSSFTLIDRYGSERLLDGVGPLDILVANDSEAQSLSADLFALTGRAALVVVKRGAAGASAYFGHDTWNAGACPVVVVDTTGAGDAFDAAFLVEWLTSRNVDRALQAGNRLGAHVAGHLGAQPPI
jgi:sugar/nucleoside kinase (ribokinase family)